MLVARMGPGDAVRVVRVAPAGSQGLAFEGESPSDISVLDPSTCRIVSSGSFTRGGLLLLVIGSNGIVEGGTLPLSAAGDSLEPTTRCAAP